MRSLLSRRFALAVLAGGLSFSAQSALAGLVTLGSGSSIEADLQTFQGNATKSDSPAAVPYNNSVTAVLPDTPDNHSTTGANLTDSAFVITFDQLADIADPTGKAHLIFSVASDTQYSIGGSYGASDTAFLMTLNAKLFETDSPDSPLYESDQKGNFFGPKTLTLGGSDGASTLSGSATGTLLAGKTYEFDVLAGFTAPIDPAANGTVTLALLSPGPTNPPPSTPLPAALWVGLGMGSSLLIKKRKSSRTA
jgi:hypothetical protein